MFGGLVIPVNSRQLWKSGSRLVIYDPGANEVEKGVNEVVLYSTEANDFSECYNTNKYHGNIAFIYFVMEIQDWMGSFMRMNANMRDLFLYAAFVYYNPLLLATLMVWLWGINLWFFSQGGVNYPKIFDLDQNHLTDREVWKIYIPLKDDTNHYFLVVISLPDREVHHLEAGMPLGKSAERQKLIIMLCSKLAQMMTSEFYYGIYSNTKHIQNWKILQPNGSPKCGKSDNFAIWVLDWMEMEWAFQPNILGHKFMESVIRMRTAFSLLLGYHNECMKMLELKVETFCNTLKMLHGN